MTPVTLLVHLSALAKSGVFKKDMIVSGLEYGSQKDGKPFMATAITLEVGTKRQAMIHGPEPFFLGSGAKVTIHSTQKGNEVGVVIDDTRREVHTSCKRISSIHAL